MSDRLPYWRHLDPLFEEWGNMVAGSAFDRAAAKPPTAWILPPGPPAQISGTPERKASGTKLGNADEDKISDKSEEGGFPGVLIGMLAAAINSRDPSSLDVIERLQRTEKAALWLLGVIADQRFRAQLVDCNDWMENEREGGALLRNMAVRAAQALERNQRSKRRGRPKKIIPPISFPTALEFCALIVGLRWEEQCHRWPRRDNSQAQLLCEELWKRAGGNPHGAIARDGALTAWRAHLKTAKEYAPPHPVGERVKHILVEAIPKERCKPRPRNFRRHYVYPRLGVSQLADSSELDVPVTKPE
jgi:hypothetical protein